MQRGYHVIKKLTILLCILTWAACAGAQQTFRITRHGVLPARERTIVSGVDYHNISRTWQKIDLAGENTLVFAPVLRGVAITSGHSFFFHDRPFLRIINLGIDMNWIDLEYGNWKKDIDGDGKWMHKVDLGIGGGPSIYLRPTRKMWIYAYFRYNPTVSLVAHNFAGDEDGKFELVVGYASYFSTGLGISWGPFSVSGEYRYGGGKYSGIRIPDVTISREDIDDLLGLTIRDALSKQRHTMHGWRLSFGFRF